MLKRGKEPFLECSSEGIKRLSAFHARPKRLNGETIEVAYQAMKVFEDGSTNLHWRDAKGRQAVNQRDCAQFYEGCWRSYIYENNDLLQLILQAPGLSDKFGQEGHVCQADVLWTIRERHLQTYEHAVQNSPKTGFHYDCIDLDGTIEQIIERLRFKQQEMEALGFTNVKMETEFGYDGINFQGEK